MASSNVTAISSHQYYKLNSAVYPPDTALTGPVVGAAWSAKKKSAGTYSLSDGYQRYYTGGLSGLTITAVTLHFWLDAGPDNADTRNLVAEWYVGANYPGTGTEPEPADWAVDVGSSALSVALSSLTPSSWNAIPLSNIGSLNQAGYTALRFGISGGEPTGINQVAPVWAGGQQPYLVVEYTSGYGHDVLGVPAANIDNIMGVPAANIAKFNGV